VDEGGDDQARVDNQRGENFAEKCPTGTPVWLHREARDGAARGRRWRHRKRAGKAK
jgi:hypothetical protein